MMARSTKGSNQRPHTLMQDRTSANSKNFSCNARPDHTLGSQAGLRRLLDHVRFTPENGHKRADVAMSALCRFRTRALQQKSRCLVGERKVTGRLRSESPPPRTGDRKHRDARRHAPPGSVDRSCGIARLAHDIAVAAAHRFNIDRAGGPTPSGSRSRPHRGLWAQDRGTGRHH